MMRLAFKKAMHLSVLFGFLLFLCAETNPTISIDVTEAYLDDVLKLLSKQSGLSFVPSEDAANKKVTLYLDKVPVDAALKTILEANHLVLRERGDETTKLYVITSSGTSKFATLTKVFHLKYARVSPSAGESSGTFGMSGSLLTQTFGSSSGSSGGAGGLSSSGGGAGFSGGGGLGSSGGVPQNTGFMATIRSLLTEHGSVIADPRTNSIIITDVPERFPVIEETIAILDVKPTQIYLEAEVVEVTMETLRRLGLEFGDSNGIVGHYVLPSKTAIFPFPKGALSSGTTSLGTLSFADANIVFKLLATEQDVKFLARPRLVTLNNEVAEIRIISESVTGVTSSSQSQTGVLSQTPERTTVGTILRVTPMVNDNRYITMVIEPEVSKVTQSSSFSSFLDPSRRIARTTVMVPNGGTAMVAGLISTENSKTGRRVPGIGDIPLIGLPFKPTETKRANTEILIFITPRLVSDETPEIPAPVQDREQEPLSKDEKHFLENHNQDILKDRAITETIENILR